VLARRTARAPAAARKRLEARGAARLADAVAAPVALAQGSERLGVDPAAMQTVRMDTEVIFAVIRNSRELPNHLGIIWQPRPSDFGGLQRKRRSQNRRTAGAD